MSECGSPKNPFRQGGLQCHILTKDRLPAKSNRCNASSRKRPVCHSPICCRRSSSQSFFKNRTPDDRIYTPLVTLAMFLSQCQDADPSLRQAVTRLIAHRVAQEQSACSSNTGAYSKARQ